MKNLSPLPVYDIKALLNIENSTLCGANCIMCPRDNFKHPLETMSMECFKKTIDESVSLGIRRFSICGLGDPLMDPHLQQRFEYAKINYPDVELSMITTGHLLKGEMLKTVCDYMDIIKISCHGFTKSTYEKVHRGNLKYESVKINIDEFLSLEKRPYTIMTFLDLPENHEEMSAWQEYYEPKAERVDIWKPFVWGGDAQIETEPEGPCWRTIDLLGLNIHTDGSVSVCCFDYNRELVIGNILEDSLSNIINGERAQYIRNVHSNNKVMSSKLPCKNCDKIRGREDALIYSNGDTTINYFSLTNFEKERKR